MSSRPSPEESKEKDAGDEPTEIDAEEIDPEKIDPEEISLLFTRAGPLREIFKGRTTPLPPLPELNLEGVYIKKKTSVQISGPARPLPPGFPKTPQASQGWEFTFALPFQGEAFYFQYRPDPAPTGRTPQGKLQGDELLLRYRSLDGDEREAALRLKRDIKQISLYLQAMNSQRIAFNDELKRST